MFLGTINETIGHREAYNSDNDIPIIITGRKELMKEKSKITCEAKASKTDKITQYILNPVVSTIFPNNGDEITVPKKNKLK